MKKNFYFIIAIGTMPSSFFAMNPAQQAIIENIGQRIDMEYDFWKNDYNKVKMSKVFTHLEVIGLKDANTFHPDNLPTDNLPKGFENEYIFKKYDCAWSNFVDAAKISYDVSHNTETYQEMNGHYKFNGTLPLDTERLQKKFAKLKKIHKEILEYCFKNN